MTDDASRFISSLKNVDASSFNDETDRAIAVTELREALDRLMRPIDHVYQLTWSNPAYVSALKILLDVDLYRKWVDCGAGPKTVAELSELSGIEEGLLIRILRHIVAQNGLKQTSSESYELTPFTKSLAGPSQSAFRFETTYPAFLNLPDFLAKTSYKAAIDPKTGNWQYLMKSPQSWLEWLWSDPARTQSFSELITAYNTATPQWTQLYPTEQLLEDLKPDRAVVVDIGGSAGIDLMSFAKKHPEVPATGLINQELPQVIDKLPAPKGYLIMAQDVFEPQVVNGARLYFMHFLLHGFNDEQSLVALKNLAAAMERGYSKLVLHELVIDDTALSPAATAMDLNMMATLSASERTRQDWTRLLEQAGMKVTRIYTSPTINESIIEAGLA